MVDFLSRPDEAIRDRKANGGQGMKWIRKQKDLKEEKMDIQVLEE